MDIRLLGQVGLGVADRVVPVARSHCRCVLAVLAMTPGRLVDSETLIDRVWGERPPRSARHSLHTHIAAIRRLVETVGEGRDHPELRRVGSGYVLEAGLDHVDLHRSRRLAEQARTLAGTGSDRDLHAVTLLRKACSLWRGTPLAGLTADWAVHVRGALEQERLNLFIDRYAAELRVGEHNTALGPLAELLAEHPLVEPLAGLQMLALYRSGRLADAVDSYAQIRQRLVEQLGDEPGPELRQLHQQVLRRDPGLDLKSAEVVGQSMVDVELQFTPALLPPDIAAFAGREKELHALDKLLLDDEQRSNPVIISAIDGAAGVGKTALAVHWAHRVAHRFPDGQLYANLAGYDMAAQPKDPIDIVHGFLEAMQVPAERIPRSQDALTGMYRSLLNDRRMLVVLDNARDANQVRPLLPGGAGCFVIVTSRSQLTGLVATECAHALTLDRLTSSEARQLLARRLGRDWVSADPVSTDEIITQCGHLPLALAVVAARATSHRACAARDLAAALREAGGALDLLSGPDPATDLRAVISWSYRALSDEAAQMFRLLGLWPVPDFSVAAIASLVGVPMREARRVLAELAHSHLINQYTPARFGVHDLLREYAAMLTREYDAAAVRDAATQRVLDFYVHTAHRAAVLINPQREPIELHPLRPAVSPVDLDDQQAAVAWLNLEYPTIRAWTARAAGAGYLTHTWQLAWAIPDFLQRRGLWNEWAASQQVGLDAAQRLGNSQAVALALRGLAAASGAMGQYGDAHGHLARALELFSELGHRMQHARTLLSISAVLSYQDRFDDALTNAKQALALFEREGDLGGQAYAHNGMGWLHARLGKYDEALSHSHRALILQQRVGDTYGEAATLDTIGYAHHLLGDFRQAIDAYERSIVLARAHGALFREAEVTSRLGDTLSASGDRAAARQKWSHSLCLLDQLQRPEVGDLRASLNASLRT